MSPLPRTLIAATVGAAALAAASPPASPESLTGDLFPLADTTDIAARDGVIAYTRTRSPPSRTRASAS